MAVGLSKAFYEVVIKRNYRRMQLAVSRYCRTSDCCLKVKKENQKKRDFRSNKVVGKRSRMQLADFRLL